MFRIKPVSFDDLVAPQSRRKIVVLLEVVSPSLCESLECSLPIATCLNIKLDSLPNDYEHFINSGFLTLERAISEANQIWAETTLDFFRQRKMRDAVKSYLFINERLIGHSHDGHTAVMDILRDIAPQFASAAKT